MAFGLFGLADTFAAYNHIETCTNSLADSNINYLSVAKSKKSEGSDYWRTWGYKLSQDELHEFKDNTGNAVYGVYTPLDTDLSLRGNIDTSVEINERFDIYSPRLSGFGTVNDEIIKELGFTILAGNLPDGTKNEIAISEYIFEIFKKSKYTDGKTLDSKTGKLIYTEISQYSDMVGKTLLINGIE